MNDMIRQAAASHVGVLFDQADIEFWNNSNTARLPRRLCRTNGLPEAPDYQEVSLGGPGRYVHGGPWQRRDRNPQSQSVVVLLARLAGWDGIPQLALSQRVCRRRIEASV